VNEQDADTRWNLYISNVAGTSSEVKSYKLVKCPFERFVITVRLTTDNKFVAIEGVSINKDFLSYAERSSKLSGPDVDKYYEE